MKIVAQVVQVVPGVQTGFVAVRPADFQRIIPDKFEVCRLNIGRNRVRIEKYATGPFLDAGGAGTSGPDVDKRDLKSRIIIPGEFENSTIFESSNVTRGTGHKSLLGREMSVEGKIPSNHGKLT